MTEQLLIAIILGVIVIVFTNVVAKRIGVAGPLLLVAVGVVISVMPGISAITVAPEIILTGVLPPLLYSAAVSAPAIEFRRDIAAISGLSVALVIISSLVLGVFFLWAIPGLGFPLAVALGAILSPTDAVATTIVRKLGVPRRIVTVLEGESLVNDATALVLLRTGIVAAAAGFSFLPTLGSFAWAVLWAVLVGVLAGALALRLRSWVSSPTANTALGLTVPFLAYLPSEALGGSGLVAAVIAGIVCGQGALRWLTPEQRMSDKLNWRTVEYLFEGAIFLLMGLELFGIVQKNMSAHEGLFHGIGIAALAFVIIVAVRALYVFPMMKVHASLVKRAARARLAAHAAAETEHTERLQRNEHTDANALDQFTVLPVAAKVHKQRHNPKRLGRMRADIDYFDTSPLTWRHNAVIIWAGMRGAVTLAAAQTLPRDTPQWDLLVFIAFLVAASSLLLQGLTLPALVRALGLRKQGGKAAPYTEIRKINGRLRRAAQDAIDARDVRRHDHTPFPRSSYRRPASLLVAPRATFEDKSPREALEFELALLGVMRATLHEIGRSGRHSTSALRFVLDELDAYEISIQLHLESEQ